MNAQALKALLDEAYERFAHSGFITDDPTAP